jgi:NTE family protein
VADVGLLGRVAWVSSVSGDSIANGLFAHNYTALAQDGFTPEALDQLVIRPFVSKISKQSLTWKLIGNAWRLSGSAAAHRPFGHR